MCIRDRHHTLADLLLTPTRIYVNSIRHVLAQFPLHAIAHITGGGLTDNIPRTLPVSLCADIDLTSWEIPALFRWLAECGHIDVMELLRTFNCGVGMVVCVKPDQADACLHAFTTLGENAWRIGHIRARKTDEPAVCYRPS